MEKKSTRTKRAGDAPLTTSSKLEQIRAGGKVKLSKGGSETKDIVLTSKDGGKTIKRETEEKFEESTVLRKKQNYVMYESKLGTEKTTEIEKIEAPKPKPKPKVEPPKPKPPKPVRQPEPHVQETIIIKKKRKEYLDNYQYHETKNIKNTNPRFFVIVEHKRLGGPVGGIYQETYMERKVFSEGSNRPQITEQNSKISTAEAQKRLISNKSEANLLRNRFLVTNPEASETTVNKRTTKTTTTTTTTKNEGPKVKSETITQQKKVTRRASGKQSTEVTTKTEIKGEKHEKPEEKLTTRSSRTTTEKVGNAGSGKKVQQSSTTTTTTKTTTTTTTKKGGNASENIGTKVETKTETKIEKKGGEVVEGGASSIRKKYAKGKREFQITKAV